MKAMVLHGTEKIESMPLKYEEYPTPIPGAGEVLVKVISCGVCHSNLHMIEGDWVKYGTPAKLPIIPGHEIIGEIKELGEGVVNLKPGQNVGISPLWNTCGACEYCLSGNEQVCDSAQITGETVDGGYAEYILAKANYVYKIPDGINLQSDAPLFCPGVTAYRASKLAELGPESVAFIIGIGGVGHVAIQTSKLFGAHVVAISTNDEHAQLAKEVGADDVILTNRNYDNLEKYHKSASSVIVFSPSQKAIDASLKLVKKMGTVVMGVFGDLHDFRFINEIKVRGSLIGPRRDMNEVLSLASKGKLKIKTTKFQMTEANEVLKMMKDGKIIGRAVLLP
ncbi:MAG: alcohol dehydrogenase catalytic domain-containing protein [Conexivisphaerales archaeon]